MTKQAKEKVLYTLATHAAEKMVPSRKAVHLCKQIAGEHISADKAVEMLKQSYGLKSKNRDA